MDILLALTAFCLPLSIAASSLTVFPLVGVYILGGRWTFKRWPPSWGPVESAFAVFWGISLLSALFSVSPAHSRDQLTEDLYALLIPVLGALLINQSDLRDRLLKIFVWGGVITAGWGLLQVIVGIDQSEWTHRTLVNIPSALSDWPQGLLKKLSLNDGRATGLRGHPLTFAETLLFPLAVMLSRLAALQISWRTWTFQTGVLVAGLLGSQSRGPWLAFGVMTLSLFFLAPKPYVWKRVGLLIALPIALILCTPALRTRALSIGDMTHLSNSERLMMWKAGWTMLKDHPLLGVGPGHVRRVSDRYQTPEQHAAFGTWGHLHNTYVHIAAERGFFGLSAFFLFIGTLGNLLWRAYRRREPGPYERNALLLAAILALIGWGVSGLTEAVYNNSSIQMMFYFVMGIALAAERDRAY